MGNCCCSGAKPCDTVEERSGLLPETTKDPTAPTEAGVVGELQDCLDTDVQLNKSGVTLNKKEENEELTAQGTQSSLTKEEETAKPQENGPVLTQCKETEEYLSLSDAELKTNSNCKAQDKVLQHTATINGPLENVGCASESLQKECAIIDENNRALAETEVLLAEALAISIQGKLSDDIIQKAEDANPQNSTLEVETTTKHITVETVNNAEAVQTATQSPVDSCSGVTSQADESSFFIDSRPPLESSREEHASSQDNCVESTGNVLSSLLPKDPSGSTIAILENGSTTSPVEDVSEELSHGSYPEPSCGFESTGAKQNGMAHTSSSLILQQESVFTSLPAANECESLNVDEKIDLQCPPNDLSEDLHLDDQNSEELASLNLNNEVLEGTEEKDVVEVEDMTPSKQMINSVLKGEPFCQNKGKELAPGVIAEVDVEVVLIGDCEHPGEEELSNREEDLYRGAEELSPEQLQMGKTEPLLEITLPKVKDRCSLAPAVDILLYSEKEWKGNTAKSAIIKKGYKELSRSFGTLRRVRGDNYCALRATLFQGLSCSTQLPACLQEDDISMLPEELEAREGLIGHWMFPAECQTGEKTEDAVHQLKRYIELLRNRWQAAVGSTSAEERRRLCEQVFQGGEEEVGLLEALKLLMLGRALELYACMQEGSDVPVFCWLLFARDSSQCPRTFFSNHLSQVGFSGGLEQVEMFLLGHALQSTIKVYRLYMAETEEFVTYYPDDHKEDWPCLCLVTEDDRHYNVPVKETFEFVSEDLASS